MWLSDRQTPDKVIPMSHLASKLNYMHASFYFWHVYRKMFFKIQLHRWQRRCKLKCSFLLKINSNTDLAKIFKLYDYDIQGEKSFSGDNALKPCDWEWGLYMDTFRATRFWNQAVLLHIATVFDNIFWRILRRWYKALSACIDDFYASQYSCWRNINFDKMTELDAVILFLLNYNYYMYRYSKNTLVPRKAK